MDDLSTERILCAHQRLQQVDTLSQLDSLRRDLVLCLRRFGQWLLLRLQADSMRAAVDGQEVAPPVADDAAATRQGRLGACAQVSLVAVIAFSVDFSIMSLRLCHPPSIHPFVVSTVQSLITFAPCGCRASADRFQAEYLDVSEPDLGKTEGKGATLEALSGRLVSVESRSTYERVIKA